MTSDADKFSVLSYANATWMEHSSWIIPLAVYRACIELAVRYPFETIILEYSVMSVWSLQFLPRIYNPCLDAQMLADQLSPSAFLFNTNISRKLRRSQ